MMKLNLVTLAIMLAMSGAPAGAQTASQTPTGMSPGTEMVGVPGCHFGEKIDSSTVSDARRVLTKAGYTSISGLKKSCDNHWHGHAQLNGVMTNVMVTPDGRVVQEGS
ncbi:MAG: hypothetical protein R3D05_04170 [Dongiaceae bacterium]